MVRINPAIQCTTLILLIVGTVVSQKCMDEPVYEINCNGPFKESLNSPNFVADICSTREGEAIFDCMLAELSCETHKDKETQQLFRNIFRSYEYERLVFCEVYTEQACNATFRCAVDVYNYAGDGLLAFYDLFCRNPEMTTMKQVVDCMTESAELCPNMYSFLYNTTIITSEQTQLTYGELNQDIIIPLCPKITESSLTCMTPEIVGKCRVSTKVDLSKPEISCTYTQHSGTCMAENCDGGFSEFFINVFQTISCGIQTVACAEDTDNRATWPITEAVTIAVAACNPGYEGSNFRRCKVNGNWDVSYDTCTLITTTTTTTTPNSTTSTTTTTTTTSTITTTTTTTTPVPTTTTAKMPVNVTEEVENLEEVLAQQKVTNGEEPTKEEITNIAEPLNNIATGLEEQGDNPEVTQEQEETIFEAVDEILELPAVEVQANIQQNKQETPPIMGGTVLVLVETVAKARSSERCSRLSSGSTTQTVKNNLLIEYGKFQRQDIKFPTVNDVSSSINATNATIEIPSQTLLNQGLSEVCMTGALFPTIGPLLKPGESIEGTTFTTQNAEVNSDVISLQLAGVSGTMDPPIKITFELKNDNLENPLCAFWDKTAKNGAGDWSTVGCSVTSETNTTVTCDCNHLTNFCVLMSPKRVSSAHAKALSIISAVGCAISIVCILLTMIVHWLVWRLVRSDRSVILMNLCIVLLLGLVLFLAGINRTESRTVCAIIAAFLQFLFLTVFFLMLLTGVEILICIIHVYRLKFRIKILLPISYIIPAIIVAISLGVTKGDGYGNDEFCWLDIQSGLVWSFIGPALFVIFVNFIVVMIVFKKMASTTLLKSKSTKSQVRTCVRSICVLMPVMGLAWVFGVVSVNQEMPIFAYMFAIFNTLQGLFIFLMHCVFNRHVRDALKHRQARKRSKASFSSNFRKQSTSQTMEGENNSSPKRRKVSSTSLFGAGSNSSEGSKGRKQRGRRRGTAVLNSADIEKLARKSRI